MRVCMYTCDDIHQTAYSDNLWGGVSADGGNGDKDYLLFLYTFEVFKLFTISMYYFYNNNYRAHVKQLKEKRFFLSFVP